MIIIKLLCKQFLLSIFPLINITGIYFVDNILWHIIISLSVFCAGLLMIRIKNRSWNKLYFDAALVFTVIIYYNIGHIIDTVFAILSIVAGFMLCRYIIKNIDLFYEQT